MKYFVPKTCAIKLPSGGTCRLIRGIREVPDVVADSKLGIDAGIKPVEEMTDAEYRSIGLKRPAAEPASAAEAEASRA
ncbi:hypothetical protein [Beijerinckia sp. L45]|uniref:hypothetical protein n=1 Tax=Beijerinckia sp. L45 TaxID=1641855 RepID=UPI00131B3A81|nr:hypothetical protein [Beijerinckia sp. L45]